LENWRYFLFLIKAVEAKLEGDLRAAHSKLITNAEEISFYNGGDRELSILNSSYLTLIRHVNNIYGIRIAYNMFEDFLVKYTWSAIGLCLCSIPVFFPSLVSNNKTSSLEELNDAGNRTEGFMINKRLMISLADAGGRIMYANKELAELSGYTSRVYDLLEVFQDLKDNIYVKKLISQEFSLDSIEGKISDGKEIVSFDHVPVVTPSGECLVRDLSFSIEPGMHVLITGPNGVGKSSIVRILSKLWPCFSGSVSRPDPKDIIFIPQKPYLSIGTLRDQIIYPQTYKEMLESGKTEEDLKKVLEIVHLAYLPDREGGFDTIKEWKDILSGGEKQRMNLARMFYAMPKYAVLDECTSAVSTDVEGLMYNYAKKVGITLITISHRPSLFKHHSHLLIIQDKGTWEFKSIVQKEMMMNVETEVLDLKKKIAEEQSILNRIEKINSELGVVCNAIKK
jgi:ATP-binding cassette subfamily D (ALD) long-chain fatty acid import protein